MNLLLRLPGLFQNLRMLQHAEASDDEATEVEEVHSPMSIAWSLICCRICQLECLLQKVSLSTRWPSDENILSGEVVEL